MTNVENLSITQKGADFYTFDVENFLVFLMPLVVVIGFSNGICEG